MKRFIPVTTVLLLLLLRPVPAFALTGARPEAGVSISGPAEEVRKGGEFTISVIFEFPEGTHQNLEKDFFYLILEGPPGFILEEIIYPEASYSEGIYSYHGSTVLKGRIRVSPEVRTGQQALLITAAYQLCDEQGLCFFPEQIGLSQDVNVSDAPSARILWILLLSFLGGIILNIMPCVLPVLSIRALTMAKARGEGKSGVLSSSLAYAGGILASLLILALVVIGLKLTGNTIGWGFHFQEKGFVLFLFSLLVLFSLSLFDLFIIRVPGISFAGGKTGSFASGILVVLLATPCTAPLLGTALGFAFSGPPLLILGSFLSIGLGLSFPFIILGILPSAAKIIPKPGPWMNYFKIFLGFILLGLAAEMLDILIYQAGREHLFRMLLYALFLGLTAWLYGIFSRLENSRRTRVLALIAAAAAIILSFSFSLRMLETKGRERVLRNAEGRSGAVSSDSPFSAAYGWETYSPGRIAEAREAGLPVFVIFSAKWCLTCRTNEARVLTAADILTEFARQGIRIFYADFTDRDPIIAEGLRQAGRSGVPVYLYYRPGAAEPVVLPELLTKRMILDLISDN